MPDQNRGTTTPSTTVAGFGSQNTRSHNAGYQDRWVAGTGHNGAWLAVADGIGGGPAGQEAAEVAVGLAQVILGAAGRPETRLRQLFDAAFVSLRPWWVQSRGGGTTLTVATLSEEDLWVACVGDSPAYVDFGTGFGQVTEPAHSHQLKDWLGSDDRPQPWLARWRRAEHQVRGVIVTSDGVDHDVVSATTADRSAADIVASLQAAPSLRGDDASAAVAVVRPSVPGRDSTQLYR